MKKTVLGVVVALLVASPAMAAKKKAPAAQPTAWELNEPGRRLLVGSIPIYLPSWAIPIYLAHQQPAAEPKKSKKK